MSGMTLKRVLSGIQATADSTHLGNYLGAVRQWVTLQDKHDAFYCIADLHTLTVETEPGALRRRTLATAAQLLASGVDPDRCTFFLQSHVAQHNQLAWVMECLAGFGEASRMTQFKDKSSKSGSDRTVVGLFTYPMLMAADILLYQADLVPVGEDQRQHLEITRDLAERFNSRYGKTFQIPSGYILESGSKIYDLQNPTSKMSKSSSSIQGIVEIMDAPEINAKKIRSAVTDTGREVIFNEKEKPGISNLMTIHSTISGKTITQIENDFIGKGYGDFKTEVADVVIEFLRPIRQRSLELLEDEGALLAILHAGAAKARIVAEQTLTTTYKNLGLVQ
jgi:tryptophanyl-tRNA synthetase